MEKEWKIQFKSDVNPRDITWFTYSCGVLFLAAIKYFQDRGWEFVVTSLKTDRSANLKTVSSTHEDGRAFDIRSRNLTELEIENLIKYFEKHYSNIGAISYSDNKARPVVYHNNHLHFQVRKDGSGIIG